MTTSSAPSNTRTTERGRTCTTALLRAAVALVALWLGSEARAGSVQPLLLLGDRDVSTAIEALVVFSPLGGTEGPPVECVPAEPCHIPLGEFAILLRSPTHVGLERPKFISDTPPGGHPKIFALHVFPAAFLKLGAGRFREGSVLTLIDVESGLTFKRVLGPDGTTVKAPAREVVPALFDGDGIVDLWKPLAPKPAERIELPENPPLAKGRGQLVVSLLFPPGGTAGGNRSVAVRWKSEAGTFQPAMAVTGDAWRWTGFWFDLPSGEGALEVESKEWTLADPAPVTVPDRGTGFARELRVIPRPSLRARFEENDRLPGGEAEVELLDCRRLAGQTGPPHYSLCTSVSNVKGAVAGEFLFRGLDPVLHALRWKVGELRDFHMVSLRDGQSREVTIPVVIYEVRGRVTRHERPVPEARITWRHFGTEVESPVTADEEGRYEVLLAQSGQYFAFLDGAGFDRHAEVVSIEEDSEADFVVPANRTEALVLDARSGKPIPEAFVTWGLEAAGKAQMGRAERVGCDADGKARLPPFPPGRVTVVAKARGYRISEERQLEITKESASADLEFRLEEGVETPLRVVDANGNPARGAWAQLPSGATSAPANDAGETLFEELVRPGDPVFVASATGAVVLARFPGEDVPIRIGEPSRPFTVRILSADGRGGFQQQITYTVDGIQVPQPMDYLARRAAGGDVYSRRDGSLIVAGLPANGILTIWPSRKRDSAVTRPLPVTEVLELRVP